MRTVIASLVILGLFSSTGMGQAPSAGAAGGPAIKACSVLTKDLVMKFSGAPNKAVFNLPPNEEPVGKSGSACDFANIRLQIDPFTWATLEAAAKKDKMTPVPAVGDAAYFGYRNSQFAEMMGRAGGHTFTIQLGVSFQSTPEQMKPNVIGLAQAIVPKLK